MRYGLGGQKRALVQHPPARPAAQVDFFFCSLGEKQNLEVIFSAVMNAITDPELPVRIQAAVALPEMVRYEEVRARMVPNIGRIMQGSSFARADRSLLYSVSTC